MACCHTFLKGDRFKIYEALPVEGQGNPGEILSIGKKELLVATAQGALSLKQVQPAGKPKMDIASSQRSWTDIDCRRTIW